MFLHVTDLLMSCPSEDSPMDATGARLSANPALDQSRKQFGPVER